MTPERYQEVGRLYRAALELEPTRWTAYLTGACGGDEALRLEVAALLAYEARGESLLDQSALEAAARGLAEDQIRTGAASEAPSLVGQSVGHFRILSLLGKGGMGEVWLAEDAHLSRQVAVKLLPAEFTADAERVRRFAQEAHAVSALNHPNIITIHDIGEIGQTHYIVTEYVAGETLRQRLTDAPDKRIKPAEALELAAQVAAALAAAHEAGITHRDIKPENVMVRRDGIVKVLDFGLAKLTERRSDGATERVGEAEPARVPSLPRSVSLSQTDPRTVLGTLRYMSPEQARGEPVDARTDIFSLGVVLYELLAGRPPFAGATTNDLLTALLQDEPPPLLAAPPEVARILGKALRKDRAERYQTVKEFWLELKDLTEAQAFAARLERSDSTSRSASPIAGAAPFASRSKTSLALTLAVLLSALAALAYFTRTSDDSLAVLPFVNAGGDGNDDYLPDGITETLINNLSQLPHLKVIARNSIIRYKGREIDPQAAGRELGVRAVLTGSVTQRGESLRISAELMNVADKSQLWGRQFDVKAADLLAVQEELARQISASLRVKITGADQQRLAKRYTENPEAYRFYLLGRYFWNKFGPEANRKAIENFNLAIAQDRNYALAYTGLAKAYGAMGLNGEAPTREVLPKSKAAALKALELDNQLAEAHAALAGNVMFFERDWATAEREFRRSLELNANDPLTHVLYAYLLTARGRFDEALAQAKLNQQLDPVSLPMYANLVRAYYYARRYDEALETNRKALELDPNFPTTHLFAGAAYEQKGRYAEAILELQQANRLPGGFPAALGALGHVYAASGRRDEALKTLAELTTMSGQRHVSPLDLAILYAGLGAQAQALELLEKAAEDRVGWLINLPVEPRFDSLRAEPRFQALLRRLEQAP